MINQDTNGGYVKMSWNEVIEACYDKQLSYCDNVIRVIYSDDRTERAVILQRMDKLYSVTFEKLFPYHDDELKYLTIDSLPAYWSPGHYTNSIFDTVEGTVDAIMSTPPFKYNRTNVFIDGE